MNASPSRHPAEILIAEDSPTQAEKLKFILEQNDLRVVAARDGREAPEAIRTRIVG